MTLPVHRRLVIFSDDRDECRRWRIIQDDDAAITRTMPEQLPSEPLLSEPDEEKAVEGGRYGTFLDLMENGPNEEVVQKLGNMVRSNNEKRRKIGTGFDYVVGEALTGDWIKTVKSVPEEEIDGII